MFNKSVTNEREKEEITSLINYLFQNWLQLISLLINLHLRLQTIVIFVDTTYLLFI